MSHSRQSDVDSLSYRPSQPLENPIEDQGDELTVSYHFDKAYAGYIRTLSYLGIYGGGRPVTYFQQARTVLVASIVASRFVINSLFLFGRLDDKHPLLKYAVISMSSPFFTSPVTITTFLAESLLALLSLALCRSYYRRVHFKNLGEQVRRGRNKDLRLAKIFRWHTRLVLWTPLLFSLASTAANQPWDIRGTWPPFPEPRDSSGTPTPHGSFGVSPFTSSQPSVLDFNVLSADAAPVSARPPRQLNIRPNGIDSAGDVDSVSPSPSAAPARPPTPLSKSHMNFVKGKDPPRSMIPWIYLLIVFCMGVNWLAHACYFTLVSTLSLVYTLIREDLYDFQAHVTRMRDRNDSTDSLSRVKLMFLSRVKDYQTAGDRLYHFWMLLTGLALPLLVGRLVSTVGDDHVGWWGLLQYAMASVVLVTALYRAGRAQAAFVSVQRTIGRWPYEGFNGESTDALMRFARFSREKIPPTSLVWPLSTTRETAFVLGHLLAYGGALAGCLRSFDFNS